MVLCSWSHKFSQAQFLNSPNEIVTARTFLSKDQFHAGQSFEAMEAIIGLYNAGVTGETCTATTAALAACGTSYRPADNITRAEMASMVKELLDHTNARPAGVTIQPTSASGVAGTIATTISYTNNHSND